MFYLLITAFLLAQVSLVAAGTSLTFSIAPLWHGEPLHADSLRYLDGAGDTFSVSRLSLLLSGFAVESESGNWTELTGQNAWIDFESQRFTFLLREIPPGKYRSIRFHVGPDSVANAADISKIPPGDPLSPNLNKLHWSWQGGYIFLALEGLFRQPDGKLSGYSLHYARDERRVAVNLPASLDLRDNASLLIGFDLAALLNVPRTISFSRDGVSTHSRQGDPLADALQANLPGSFAVLEVRNIHPPVPEGTPVSPLYLPEHFTPYRFNMSATFPMPDLPRDNPLIVERVALGEKLFSEKALSRDETLSCVSCHRPDHGFSDPRRLSMGVDAAPGVRHSMGLNNLAWKHEFFWDGHSDSLRHQVLEPVLDHSEMDQTLSVAASKISAKPEFSELFMKAYGSTEVTAEKIALALEQYLLTLTAYRSKFDQAMAGKSELSPKEKKGFELFMTEYEPRMGKYGADCFHCHGGPLFSDFQYHNNGLDKTFRDLGRMKVTGLEKDRGKFITPSLRNVDLRAPYMHDGRFKTLEEVVDHYMDHVVLSPTLDPNLAKHPSNGIRLSKEDRQALVAFLKSLSDETKNESISN